MRRSGSVNRWKLCCCAGCGGWLLYGTLRFITMRFCLTCSAKDGLPVEEKEQVGE
jgi:hypothetical protein